MLKVEIVMDEEKILAEGKYPLKDVYFTLDKVFFSKKLKKLGEGIYCDNGSEQDFANLWVVIFALQEQEWFADNVKKWLWYNDHGGKIQEVEPEDLLVELMGA
ncbi:MAG: hypothetical protein RR540_00090 [Oscillospiraceae bacterium]